MPGTAAFAAGPVAIPPVALPACGTTAETGGWALRDFVSNGSSSESAEPTRPKGLRLGEPCVDAGIIQVPNYVRDLNNGGEWAAGAGPGAGPCTDGFIHPSAAAPDLNRVRAEEMPPGSCATVPLHNGDGTASTASVSYVSSKPDETHTKVVVTVDYVPGGTWPAVPYFRLDTMCRVTDGDDYWEPTTGTSYDGGYWVADGSGDLGAAATFELEYSDTCGGTSHTVAHPGDEPTLVISVRQPVTGHSIFTTLFTEGVVPTDAGTGGNTIGGEIAATIRVDGDGELSGTAGYYLCSIDSQGANQYQVSMTTAVEYNKDYPESMQVGEGYEDTFYEQVPLIGSQVCDYLIQIVLSVCTWSVNGPTAYSCFQTEWLYSSYQNGNGYDTGTLEENMCQYTTTPSGQCLLVLYPDPNASEGSIVCVIDYQDPANPITSIGDFFVGLPPWVACMFVPVGWDRTGKITKAWVGGAAGQMTEAYTAAVPDGIGCGPVADIPVFSSTVHLDTCTADLAPPLVKVVLAWLLVLGSVALVARRIFWAVGSK